VLVVSWGTGLVLLVGTAWLLHVRSDVALGPALWAGLACLGGCLVTASLAMAASLYLTRIATALAVLVFVAMIGSANAAEIFGAGTGALSFVLNRFAPPPGDVDGVGSHSLDEHRGVRRFSHGYGSAPRTLVRRQPGTARTRVPAV